MTTLDQLAQELGRAPPDRDKRPTWNEVMARTARPSLKVMGDDEARAWALKTAAELKAARDNPYGDDEEAILRELLRVVRKRRRGE